jgi:hypothetical protein
MASRALTLVFAVLALAGCGASEEPPAPPRPTLPVNVADNLAAQSDKVESALLAGDSCAALAEAEKLQDETIAAINNGGVPAAFEEQLTATVNDLAGRIECVEAQDDEEDRGRGKGKGKGRDKGEDD